jgi:hypothetical protein
MIVYYVWKTRFMNVASHLLWEKILIVVAHFFITSLKDWRRSGIGYCKKVK